MSAGLIGPAVAQTFNEDLAKAWQTYQAGKFEDAAKQLEEFKNSYAQDPSFPSISNRFYYLLALSLVQLQRWDQIPGVVDEYEKVKGTAPDAWGEELTFWKGRALASTGHPAEARKVFEQFLQHYSGSKRAATARLLLAISMIQAQQWNDAAELLAKMRQTARGVEWGRFLLLETLARTNAGQTDRALELVDEGHRNWRRLGQITAFELLAVQLAEKLMTEPDKSRAIRSLIRIQPRDKILEQQDQQLASLQKYYETLKKTDPNGVETLMTHGLIEQVKKERDQFAAMPNFDSSVRFRIAKAFLDSNRYRETAYVLENMLDQLPPDEIVDQGSQTLAQCYTQIGRSDKVIEVVDKFMAKFPNSQGIPRMLFQKGLAYQNLRKVAESNQILDDFLQKYPTDPLAANASFLRAFNSVLAEKFADAAERFAETQKKFPDSSVAGNALFWQAQADSMGKQSELALPLYEAYIQKYPEGDSVGEARYRHAFTLYELRNYDKAVPELEKYVADNPGDPNSAEGMLLLGDVYFGRHDYDKAVDILLRVPKGVSTYLEEAYFKVGKYYKLTDDSTKLRALFEKFQTEFPDSARLSEAIYQIGLSYRGDPAKQREIFWTAFDRFGDEPKQWGVTDILQALVKASNSPPEAQKDLLKRLRETMNSASRDNKRALQLNAAWGLAAALRADDPTAANQTLVGANAIVDPEEDNPAILMDIAAALQRDGKLDQASHLYTEIRRWNPLSPFTQTVFANLGLIAFQQGKLDEARGYFDRYFKETPALDKRGLVMLKLAAIERAAGKPDNALGYYEKVLAEKHVERVEKATALLSIGEIYLDRKDAEKAIPYLQRIYILYGAFPEVVSKAYLLSGRAFEQRGDTLAAARTYVEMLNRPDLADAKFTADRDEAGKRLGQLPAEMRAKAEMLEKEKQNPAPAAAAAAP
ncbi:MAG: tetratricopeptide repeat protein [Terrimicrobiaceae bacterium]|nr:tetratricopeptide repeat protein [Terrimicrobiaceae bacterium]